MITLKNGEMEEHIRCLFDENFPLITTKYKSYLVYTQNIVAHCTGRYSYPVTKQSFVYLQFYHYLPYINYMLQVR